MLRVEVEPGTQAVLVHLDVAEQSLPLGVLDDWLNACVGVARRPPPLSNTVLVARIRAALRRQRWQARAAE